MNLTLVAILAQLIGFIPFYLIWLDDCKRLGKDRLVVSLEERFFYWLVLCPLWLIAFLK